MLKDKASSFACSTCLRNPPKFPSLNDFNNEYALLPDPSLVKKVFRAEATPLNKMEGLLVPPKSDDIFAQFPPGFLTGNPGAEEGFNRWEYYALKPTQLLSNYQICARAPRWKNGCTASL